MRSDPLLRYMSQARHSEEHDAMDTTKHGKLHAVIDGHGETYNITGVPVFTLTENGVIHDKNAYTSEHGIDPTIIITPEGSQLHEIIDSRYGARFEAPELI